MIDLNNIPLDDKEVYKNIYHKGNTYGIFQVDSPISTKTSKRFQPNSIEEISVVIAIVRPGVLKAKSGNKSMTDIIIDRKHGIEKVEYLHPSLEPILKDTYGVLVFQEQAIRIATDIAGFSGIEADTLRKAIGKKLPEVISQLESNFIEGCKTTGIVSEDIAKLLFENIRASQRYSFNLSHSVSYSIISYQTAYLKHYYPLLFYTACLRESLSKQKPQEEVKDLVLDGRTNGIDFSIPNLTHKQIEAYIKKEVIYFGLSNIKQVGQSARTALLSIINEVEQELSRPIKDFIWTDFLFLISDRINSQAIESLIYCGALDFFKVQRSQMFFEYEKYNMLTKGEKKWIVEHQKQYPFTSLYDALIAVSPKKKFGGGCHTDKKTEFVLGLAKSVENPLLNTKDNPRFIAMMEEKYLGISITCSKTDGTYESDIANYTCSDINNGMGTINISFVGEIARFKEFKTKNGENPGKFMAFLDIFDKTGSLNESAVIFPDLWEKEKDSFDEKSSYFFVGKRSKKNSIIIENLQKIT